MQERYEKCQTDKRIQIKVDLLSGDLSPELYREKALTPELCKLIRKHPVLAGNLIVRFALPLESVMPS